jgi:predicted Zn-dependent protease
MNMGKLQVIIASAEVIMVATYISCQAGLTNSVLFGTNDNQFFGNVDAPLAINENSDKNRVVIEEYLDGRVNANSLQKQDLSIINLTGYWDTENRKSISVSFSTTENLNNAPEILAYSENVIFGENSQDNVTGAWVDELTALHDEDASIPKIEFVEGQADISVILTSDAHPSGRDGHAMVTRDERFIKSVEVTIFSADKLYEDGYLQHILEHEMGHALGLSHSNDIYSVMYPKLVMVNDDVMGAIAECEESGLVELYVISSTESVRCN